MRPSGSKEEAQFRAWLATTYPDLERIDEAGNLHFKIDESETLFVAHTVPELQTWFASQG